MTLQRLSTILAVVLILSSPAISHGDAIKDIAKQHYMLGEKLFQVGRYTEALVEFDKAYKLFPSPLLIFNMARCHELLAQFEKSIEYYERYLKMKPKDPNASVLKLRVASLKERLAARKKDPIVKEPVAKDPGAVVPADPSPAGAPPQMRDESVDGETRWTKVAGWTAVGVGAATLVTGIILGGMASARSDDFKTGVEEKKDYSELMSIKDSGETLETAQIATIVVGSVVAAAGVGLLLWDRSRGERKDDVSSYVLPYVTASGGGIAGFARF